MVWWIGLASMLTATSGSGKIQRLLRGLRDQFDSIAKGIVNMATAHAGDVVDLMRRDSGTAQVRN